MTVNLPYLLLIPALPLAGVLVSLLLANRWALGPASPPPQTNPGNTQALGELLYSRFLFPFEITSLVLLVAMVGAIVISKGRTTPRHGEPQAGETR